MENHESQVLNGCSCVTDYCFCLYDKYKKDIYGIKILDFISNNKVSSYGLTLINDSNFKIMICLNNNNICVLVTYRISLTENNVKYLTIEGYVIDPEYESQGLLTYILCTIFTHEIENGVQKIFLHSLSDFYDFILTDIYNFKKINTYEKDLIEAIFYDTNEYHNIINDTNNQNFIEKLKIIGNNLKNKSINMTINMQKGASINYLSKYQKYKNKYLKYKNENN